MKTGKPTRLSEKRCRSLRGALTHTLRTFGASARKASLYPNLGRKVQNCPNLKKGPANDMTDPLLNVRNSFDGRLTYARFPSSYRL